MTQQCQPWVFPIEKWKCVHRHPCTSVYSNYIWDSQKQENTQIFQEWLDKQTVVYPSSGIQLSNEKKWPVDTVNNLDEFQTHSTDWKKGVSECDMLYAYL